MVMYTAKLTKTRLALIVGVICLTLMLVILGVSSLRTRTEDTLGGKKAEVSFKGIASNEERIAFLNAYGWEVGEDPTHTSLVSDTDSSFDKMY